MPRVRSEYDADLLARRNLIARDWSFQQALHAAILNPDATETLASCIGRRKPTPTTPAPVTLDFSRDLERLGGAEPSTNPFSPWRN